MTWLINPAQLDRFRLNQKNITILDCAFYSEDFHADQNYFEKHIPGAQIFDVDALCDPEALFPHTLIQDEDRLGEILGDYGIRNDTKIILYDRSDFHVACRALWTLKMAGHDPQCLYLLDGGLRAWEKWGGKLEEGSQKAVTPKPYTARFQRRYLRELRDMKENLQTHHEQVVDMRHAVRFAGGPESRFALRSGHIPGSFSFPFNTMFNQDGCFLPLEKIEKKLFDIGVDLKRPIVSTCGSGVTACILDVILDVIKHPEHAVYSGSWSEWGMETLYEGEDSLSERPVETSI